MDGRVIGNGRGKGMGKITRTECTRMEGKVKIN